MTGHTAPTSDRTIAVMARPLVRGAVKTRLARALGDDGALAVYERLLRGTLDSAEQRARRGAVLAEAPDGRHGAGAAGADGAAHRRRPTRSPAAAPAGRGCEQRGDGLGERLAGVFADLFAAGAGAVVVVNSDSPALPPEYLEQAFAELARRPDLVLGPAADGGYYLIGAGRRDLGCRRRGPRRAARRRRR